MSAGRRGNGEGTIVKRADGRWAAAIIFDGFRRKWIYGQTRRDVSDRLRKIRSDVAEGRPVMNERLTMAEYLNRWLYEVAKQRTRPMTWRGYEHLVRLHILPTLGRVPLAKLTPQHVHSLVTQKVREGRLSPRTIQYMHSAEGRTQPGRALADGPLQRGGDGLNSSRYAPRGTDADSC